MNFELKKTSIYQAIKWESVFKWAKPFKILSWLLFWVFIIWALFGYFGLGKSFASQEKTFAFAVFFFSFAVIFGESNKFFKNKLKTPSLKYTLKQALGNPNEFNFAGFLSFEGAKICQKAIRLSKKNKEASLKDILLLVLAGSKTADINFVFQRGQLSKKGLQKLCSQELGKIKKEKEVDFEGIVIEAGQTAMAGGREKITTGDLLGAFAEKDPVFEKFLIESDFKKGDIKNLVDWFYKQKTRQEKLICWWDYQNLLTRGSIGKYFPRDTL